jgi:phage tail-like protein
MQMDRTVPRKKLFDYLPAIYQESAVKPVGDAQKSQPCPICNQIEDAPEHPSHLREFLESFEKVLFGFDEDADQFKPTPHDKNSDDVEGLGRKIERLHELFDPHKTRADFLPWLAGWAALSLRAGMSEKKQRELIAEIIPLYQIRGTKKYLQKLLDLCLDVDSSVSEVEIPPFQLGVHHQIGVDTYIGGGPPHFFQVCLLTESLAACDIELQRQIAYEVIESAKPAYTTYELTFASPKMQIGIHSTIGLDTVLSPTGA